MQSNPACEEEVTLSIKRKLNSILNKIKHPSSRPNSLDMDIFEKIHYDLEPYVLIANTIKKYFTEHKHSPSDIPRDILKFLSPCFQDTEIEALFFGVKEKTVLNEIKKEKTMFDLRYPIGTKKRKVKNEAREFFWDFVNNNYPLHSKNHYRITTHTLKYIIDEYHKKCEENGIEAISTTTLRTKYLKECHFHFSSSGFLCPYCDFDTLSPLHKITVEAQWAAYHEIKDKYSMKDKDNKDCIVLMDWCEIEVQKGEKMQIFIIIIYHNVFILDELGSAIRICYMNEVHQAQHRDYQVIWCLMDLISKDFLTPYSQLYIFSDVGLHFRDSLMIHFWSWVKNIIQKNIELLFLPAFHGSSPADGVGKLLSDSVKKYHRNKKGLLKTRADVKRYLSAQYPLINFFETPNRDDFNQNQITRPETLDTIRQRHYIKFISSTDIEACYHCWDDEGIIWHLEDKYDKIFESWHNI